ARVVLLALRRPTGGARAGYPMVCGGTMARPLRPLLTVVLLGGGLALAAEPARVEYPAGFRQWAHVKSMVIYSDKHPLFGAFGGFHSVYVHPKGLPAMTKGGSFPDGSVLARHLLDARQQNVASVT